MVAPQLKRKNEPMVRGGGGIIRAFVGSPIGFIIMVIGIVIVWILSIKLELKMTESIGGGGTNALKKKKTTTTTKVIYTNATMAVVPPATDVGGGSGSSSSSTTASIAKNGIQKQARQQPAATTTTATTATSTPCNWRPEPLLGKCDVIKSTPESQPYKTAANCEIACCALESCLGFQFRTKEGCLFGINTDSRLGAEKDGPSAWCEPRAPAKWQGQWIRHTKQQQQQQQQQQGKHNDMTIKDEFSLIEGACDSTSTTWNLNELSGQCFGLGSKRTTAEHSAESCQKACCNHNNDGDDDKKCAIWQWRIDAGCFYAKGGFSCQPAADPLDLEPYIGKRKVQPDRSYTPYAYSADFADLAGSEYNNV